MQIQLNEIVLNSIDPIRLFRFLNFLFDIADSELQEETVFFEMFNQKFVIRPVKSKTLINTSCSFTFNVTASAMLEDIKSSLEFYNYKETHSGISYILDEGKLIFKDVDGRNWEFIHSSHQLIQHSINQKQKSNLSYTAM